MVNFYERTFAVLTLSRFDHAELSSFRVGPLASRTGTRTKVVKLRLGNRIGQPFDGFFVARFKLKLENCCAPTSELT
jgi:hypothetical protein